MNASQTGIRTRHLSLAGNHALGILLYLLVALATTLGLLTVAAGPASAEVRTPFASRFSTNDTGDIAIVGNTLTTCPATAPNCLAARNRTATGSALNNNAYQVVNIDVDSDPTTFNSTSADFEVPDGGEVLWAGLYWGARSNAGAARAAMQLDTPASGGYQTINGTIIGEFGSPPAYHSFAEVTDLLQEGGSGTYTGANVQTTLGAVDRYAGWSLVVVYRDPAAPPRNLTVFDGFADVANNAASRVVDIPVAGFQTPPNGPVNARVGIVAYEGDAGSEGAILQFRGGSQTTFTDLSDAQNPPDNFFNSTISRLGERITAKNPDYNNQLGFDIDVVEADGIIPNGATGATLRFTHYRRDLLPRRVHERHRALRTVRRAAEERNGYQRR